VRVRLLGGGALLLIVLGLAVYGANSTLRLWQMKREIERLEGDVAALRAQTEKLATTVDRLRHDPAYIEKLAREDLGYVREGDTVLKFPSQPR
jgi:cell division protein FtsB